MGKKARDRMIAGINEVTGTNDCDEAVLLQRRSNGLALVLLVLLVAGAVALDLHERLGGIGAGGMMGLGAAVILTLSSENYWLGRCSGRAVLVKIDKLQRRPIAVVAELSDPDTIATESALISKRVTVDGQQFLMHKQFQQPLAVIAGGTFGRSDT